MRQLTLGDLRWNFVLGVADGTVFSVYLVLFDVNLVIPWLLSELTTSRTLINLAPTLTVVGSTLPQLLAARLMQSSPYRRPFMVRFNLLRTTALALMLPFLFWSLAGPGATLAAILLFYSLASFAVAFTSLPWQEMTAKSQPPDRLSLFFGIRTCLGGILGLGMALFVRSYLGTTPTVPLPKFGLLFLLGIGCLLLGTGINALMREPPGPIAPERPPLGAQAARAVALTWRHHRYRHYLAIRALLIVTSLAAPLYIVEGRTRYGLLADSIGTFTMAGLAAGIVASLVWSLLGDRLGLAWLCKTVALLSLAPPAVALAMPTIAATPLGAGVGWLVVFLLLGAAATGQTNVSFRGAIELPDPQNRSLMIAAGNGFSGIISLSGPLIGLLADMAGAPASFALAAVAALVVVPLAGRVSSPRTAAVLVGSPMQAGDHGGPPLPGSS